MIRPTSLPVPLWPTRTMPLCIRIAFAPPSTILETVAFISSRPSIGPKVTPWSIGIMTVLPESRFIILSSLIFLPIISGSLQKFK